MIRGLNVKNGKEKNREPILKSKIWSVVTEINQQTFSE
jgi:hypothetical protein